MTTGASPLLPPNGFLPLPSSSPDTPRIISTSPPPVLVVAVAVVVSVAVAVAVAVCVATAV